MEVIYSNRIPNALWRNHLPKLKRHKQQMKKKCKIGHLGENKLSSLWSQSRQPGTTFNWEWKLKIHTCASTQSFPKSWVNDIHTAHTVQIFLCSPRKLRSSNIKITMRSELELIIYGWIRTNIQKMQKQRVVNQSEDNISSSQEKKWSLQVSYNLTLYTLTSVCKFSILFSIHFLSCLQGELA